MARVTVEDCIVQVPNRFDLVMLAAQRAREIVAGAPLTLDRDDDKNPVVALREIAEETVDLEQLNGSIVQGLQKHVEMDEAEDEAVEFDLSGMDIGAEATGLVTEALAVEDDEALAVQDEEALAVQDDEAQDDSAENTGESGDGDAPDNETA